MRIKLRPPRHATIVAYIALFVAMSGTAYAATGGTLILGQPNSANKTTSLQNTGPGSALRLATKSGSTPPLAVSNSTKIANLNADLLDGVHASSLQPKLPSRLSFTPLTLINKWAGDCYGGGAPGIALDPSGVVHFHGEMCAASTNGSLEPFTVPAKFRPAQIEWVTVDFCNAAAGRLEIDPDGTVSIHGDPNATGVDFTPQCLTSLAGVTYTLPY